MALISLEEQINMLVLALQFSRSARTTWRLLFTLADGQCLQHIAAEELAVRRFVLGVEGDSLKTEEKTRPAGVGRIKRRTCD